MFAHSNRTCLTCHGSRTNKEPLPESSGDGGGGSGIRTHEELPPTRFPVVPIQPLSHPSTTCSCSRPLYQTSPPCAERGRRREYLGSDGVPSLIRVTRRVTSGYRKKAGVTRFHGVGRYCWRTSDRRLSPHQREMQHQSLFAIMRVPSQIRS